MKEEFTGLNIFQEILLLHSGSSLPVTWRIDFFRDLLSVHSTIICYFYENTLSDVMSEHIGICLSDVGVSLGRGSVSDLQYRDWVYLVYYRDLINGYTFGLLF